jgi:acetamidase/formamidase
MAQLALITSGEPMSETEVNYHPHLADYAWTFGGAKPVLTVKPGTMMRIWTDDAFCGRIQQRGQRKPEAVQPVLFNPQSGPFYVAGAEPGDTLALHFLSIEPARDWGVSTTAAYFGALTSTAETVTLQPPLPELVWTYDVDLTRRLLQFAALDSECTFEWPLDPMLGTVGLAPALSEVRSSLVPGPFGGNLDVPAMRAGTTCYLGVNVPGALFSVGDGHYRQGEGETCGTAVEGAMESVVMVELIKNVLTPWPRLEDDANVMSIGCARPLDDAFRIAQADLVHWMSAELGLSVMDAYQVVSQTCETSVASVVNPTYTIVAKVPKAWVPSLKPYGGIRSHLVDRCRGRQG